MGRSKASSPARRLLLAPLILAALAIGAEAAYFVFVLFGGESLGKADLIVAFEGRDGRARAAYKLVEMGLAPNLIISPADGTRLDAFEDAFNPTRPFARIVEENSRTTLENAVHTKELIRDHGFSSAILVTSWDHMPRAYLLLRAMLLGSGVRIATHSVPTGRVGPANWYLHSVGWKMAYNETVEVWGSLFELVQYQITGRPPHGTPGKSGWLKWVKQHLLFKIDDSRLQTTG
jgi:uncharacterized SAM-binding protein YcdF (DUF218 family)